MKRILVILLAMALLVPVWSCGEELNLSEMTTEELTALQSRIRSELNSRQVKYADLMDRAMEVLKEGWKSEYAKGSNPDTTYMLDIRGARVIKIRDSLDEKAATLFGQAAYLVEFLFYDDYHSSSLSVSSGHNAGYMDHSGINCFVGADRSGNMMLVKDNPFLLYSRRYYNNDFSSIIEEVYDFHGQYNQVIEFP